MWCSTNDRCPCLIPVLQINLPCGPFDYPLAIRVWREAWEALRRHTDRSRWASFTSLPPLLTSSPSSQITFSPYPLLSSSPSHQINFSPHHHLTSSPSNLVTISPHHFLTPRLFTFSPPHQTSDHVVEQAHQWLHQTLTKTNCVVKDLESPVHGERLFRGVMRHNAYTAHLMRIHVQPDAQPAQPGHQPDG